MDLYEALYTTRAMRRAKPDPVSEEVVYANRWGNDPGWRVEDPRWP